MVSGAVNADELDALSRDMRRARAALPEAIDKASEEAARLVADGARARASSIGSTAGHVAPSIQADGSTVGMDGSAYPMAAGAEFGGRGRPTTQQFQPYNADGYFLYPTVRDEEEQIEATYAGAIGDLIRRHDLS